MTLYCQLCHEDGPTFAGLCANCAKHAREWDALDPEQQRAEIASMDAYVDESDC